MQQENVDLLIVGWGKGGKTLAGAIGRKGQRIAMVEQSPDMVGGTCINIACVPTKALIHDADARRSGDDEQAWFDDDVVRRDKLTGAALMHVESQESINLVAMAMRHGITAAQLRDAVYTHPSVTEAANEVLGVLT